MYQQVNEEVGKKVLRAFVETKFRVTDLSTICFPSLVSYSPTKGLARRYILDFLAFIFRTINEHEVNFHYLTMYRKFVVI